MGFAPSSYTHKGRNRSVKIRGPSRHSPHKAFISPDGTHERRWSIHESPKDSPDVTATQLTRWRAMLLPLGSTLSPRCRFGAACFSPAEAAAGLAMCRAAEATAAAAAGERAPPTWRRPVVLSSRNIIKGEGCTPPRCSAKLARASSKAVRAASCVASSHAASMKDTTASQKALLLPVYLKLVAYPAKHAQHECMDSETSGTIRRKYLISVHQCFGACPTKPRTSGNMP